ENLASFDTRSIGKVLLHEWCVIIRCTRYKNPFSDLVAGPYEGPFERSLDVTYLKHPAGTTISNLTPSPSKPVSLMKIPVIPRISLTMKRPRPVFFPYPRLNISVFAVGGIP